MRIIEVFGHVRGFPPTRSLIPIWERVSAVLRHYQALNANEQAIAAMQQDALRNGALSSPSIYGEGDDVSVESFYVRHVFAYLFRHAAGDYVWLTAQLDRCFGFGVLVLPALDIALALYPFSVDQDLIRRLAGACAGADRLAPIVRRSRSRPKVVTGFYQMMHTLWNELPAIDRALAEGSLGDCEVGHLHQPLGPLDEIFPELRGRLGALPDDDASINSGGEMMVGLGSWTIPPSTQERLRAAARRLVKPHVLAETADFRDQHWPIFWISVKPPNRSFLDQASVLAGLMARLRSTYPEAGFLLDGVGNPWDRTTNPNYANGFLNVLARASAGTNEILGDIYSRLGADVRSRTRIVSDVDVLEEICWSGLADFYFCHGGSMQNKIAWIHDVSGVTHSNSSFISSARGMPQPTSGRAEAFFLPSDLVTDDNDARYSAVERARKDQNYTIGVIDDVAAFVIDRFRASRTEAPA